MTYQHQRIIFKSFENQKNILHLFIWDKAFYLPLTASFSKLHHIISDCLSAPRTSLCLLVPVLHHLSSGMLVILSWTNTMSSNHKTWVSQWLLTTWRGLPVIFPSWHEPSPLERWEGQGECPSFPQWHSRTWLPREWASAASHSRVLQLPS